MTKRVRLIGVGPGDPEQVTLEAVRAVRSVDFVVVTEKASDDPLAAARERLLERYSDPLPRIVRVPDPPRERAADAVRTRNGYATAVDDWHAARARAWADVLREEEGEAGFLVWGDPAFYDSTIRVLDRVAAELAVDLDVIPGISSLQLLAARHRIVLHEVGGPIHVTTGRDLLDAVAAGQRNLVVMLNRDLAPLDDPALDDWQVWWGANLGTDSESLAAGRVADVRAELAAARRTAKEQAGWVMDVFVLRA
jgi:precorrin-6A synthase